MRHPRPALLLLTPALLGVLALAGCGETEDPAVTVASDGAAAQPADAPTASDAPAPPTTPPAAGSTTEPESRAEASVDDADDFPDVVDPVEQGGSYGVVVLSDGGQAELAASQESVAAYGFTAYTAEIGCLQGASEALGVPDGTVVSYLVFGDIDAAQDFTSLYTYLDEDAEVVGEAEAATYCVD